MICLIFIRRILPDTLYPTRHGCRVILIVKRPPACPVPMTHAFEAPLYAGLVMAGFKLNGREL